MTFSLKGLLPYYYPTSVLVLDGDSAFLDRFLQRYDGELFSLPFDNPQAAIERLRGASPALARLNSCLVTQTDVIGDDWKPSDRTVTFRPHLVRRIIADPRRFADITVAVIAHDLPETDGLAMCRQLTGLPVKRILLTGPEADEALTVRAFNEGLIDGAVAKRDVFETTALTTIVHRLQQAWFTELTAPLWPALTLEDPSFLSDSAVGACALDALRRMDAVEYYLSGQPSGILAARADGKLKFLLIQDEATLYGREAMARQCGTAPETLLETLAGRDCQPWFPTLGNFYETPQWSEWRNHVHPAEKVGEWYVSEVDIGPERLGLSGPPLGCDAYRFIRPS